MLVTVEKHYPHGIDSMLKHSLESKKDGITCNYWWWLTFRDSGDDGYIVLVWPFALFPVIAVDYFTRRSRETCQYSDAVTRGVHRYRYRQIHRQRQRHRQGHRHTHRDVGV